MPLFALRRFQLAGHRPIALAGGATGFIGDPTGRTSERVMMTPDVVAERVERIRRQMERFLDFDGPRGAVLVDNLEWTAPIERAGLPARRRPALPGQPDARQESVSARLEGGGLSFTEFSYQLLQSNDYLELYRRYGCRLQIGGNDQWGNITAGLDLIRRVEGGDRAVHALTLPLVTDSSGAKIGKSTGGGNVWLDPAHLPVRPVPVPAQRRRPRRRAPTCACSRSCRGRRSRSWTRDRRAPAGPGRPAPPRRVLIALVHGAEELVRVRGRERRPVRRGSARGARRADPGGSAGRGAVHAVSGLAPPLVDLLAAALGISQSEARRAVRDGGAYLNNGS